MITIEGNDIRLKGSTHKFNFNGMAEYVYQASLDPLWGGEMTGDSDFGWAVIKGKRVLWCDPNGSVWLSRYATPTEAESSYQEFYDLFQGVDAE